MAQLVRLPVLRQPDLVLTVRRWLVGEGEPVAAGDPLLELEGEKSALVVEAPASGVLLRVVTPCGSVVAPGSVAAVIGSAGEACPEVCEAPVSPPSPPGRIEAMAPARRATGRRLQGSMRCAPHFYTTVSADVTELLAFRQRVRAGRRLRIGVNTFLVKAAALALRDFPRVNSSVYDDGSLLVNDRVNVGIAVDVGDGVVVPVVTDADRLAPVELQAAAKRLIDKARNGTLSCLDTEGGTFTVSNLSMLNVDGFAAIINPGESAILAVGSARAVPAVDGNGAVVVREHMRLTLSADHRVIDGALAAQFCNAIRRHLEDVAGWEALLE